MVSKIENMTTAAQQTQNPCPSCGDRGWKFARLRRSGARITGTGETTPGRLQRVGCTHCQTPPAKPGDQNQQGQPLSPAATT